MATNANAMLCPNDFHSDAEMLDFVKKSSMEGYQYPETGIDVDGDGKKDHLIGVTCGNAGCDYYVFLQKTRDDFRYVGHAFFHKDAFKVLREPGKMFGILAYARGGPANGALVRYRSVACQFDTLAQIQGTSDELWNFVKDFPEPPN